MTHLSAQIRIKVPKEKVWKVIADLSGMYRWNPRLLYSYCTSGSEQGIGTTVNCVSHGTGVYLKARVLEWREGKGYKIEVYESGFPFRHSYFEFNLDADTSVTIAKVSHDYQLKFGPLGGLVDRLWGQRVFSKAIEDLLAGLEYHLRTGVPINDRVPEY